MSGRAAEGFALLHDARFRGAGFRGAGRVKEARIGAAPCGDLADRCKCGVQLVPRGFRRSTASGRGADSGSSIQARGKGRTGISLPYIEIRG